MHVFMQALKQQYSCPPSTIQISGPFQFKKTQGSLKIKVEHHKCSIAMDPAHAEVSFITSYMHACSHLIYSALNL